MYKFFKILLLIFYKMFFRIEIQGNIDLSKEEGFILASNHISNHDPFILAAFTERQLSFMAKESLFKIPVLGYIFKKVGAFPIKRGQSDLASMKKAISILKDNNVMAMFPEGTRHKDGNFRDIKKGVGLIALKSETNIVPIRIIGNYRIFSKIVINIGEPIRIKELLNNNSKLSVDELTEIVKNSIENLNNK